MPRLLRIYLLGCIAISSGFLVWHAREPLRLNVGDAWSDAAAVSSIAYVAHHGLGASRMSEAYHPAHDAPLPDVIYNAAGKLGAGDLGTFRLVALAVSMLWAWLVFAYARRIWGDTIALLATALLATSVLWMMYADSIDRPPIVHASCFLALWGVVRAIETARHRHHLAAVVGSFGCWFGGLDDQVFLVASVLFTIYIKVGNPLARGNARFLASCALGIVAAIATRSLFALGAVDWYAGPIERLAAVDRKLSTPLSATLRRYTLELTPMFWVTLGYAAWRALRAPSVISVITDGVTWFLAIAVVGLYVAPPNIGSPMLRAEPALVFYAIGSALVIARLLERSRGSRRIAVALAAAAPAWGLYVMLSHPRSVLDRDDVAQVRAYLATSDRNDFVMTNLLADGPIQAALDRHSWPVPQLDDDLGVRRARRGMLYVFEGVGTDHVHAVIFTTPASRLVDRSLGQLVKRGQVASVTGWPYLVPDQANEVIGDYDRQVLAYLDAVGAKQVLHLRNFDVYRIDRAAVLELVGRSVPVVRELDFSSVGSDDHKLLGWDDPQLTADRRGATRLIGHVTCASPLHRAGEPDRACETAVTPSGLRVIEDRSVARAQLMIRVERACDLRLTLELARSPRLSQLASELASSPLLTLSINDFTASQCEPATRVSFVVPQRSVHEGINILTFDNRRFGPLAPRADVVSLAIEPICDAAGDAAR